MLNSGVFSSEEVLQAIKLIIAKKAMHIFFHFSFIFKNLKLLK